MTISECDLMQETPHQKKKHDKARTGINEGRSSSLLQYLPRETLSVCGSRHHIILYDNDFEDTEKRKRLGLPPVIVNTNKIYGDLTLHQFKQRHARFKAKKKKTDHVNHPTLRLIDQSVDSHRHFDSFDCLDRSRSRLISCDNRDFEGSIDRKMKLI